jgi:hypothetical protein
VDETNLPGLDTAMATAVQVFSTVEGLVIAPGREHPREVMERLEQPDFPELGQAWLAAWVDDQLRAVLWTDGVWQATQLQLHWQLPERNAAQLLQLLDESLAAGHDDLATAVAVQCLHRSWLQPDWRRADLQAHRQALLQRAGADLRVELPQPPSVPATVAKVQRVRGVVLTGVLITSAIFAAMFTLLSWELYRIVQAAE